MSYFKLTLNKSQYVPLLVTLLAKHQVHIAGVRSQSVIVENENEYFPEEIMTKTFNDELLVNSVQYYEIDPNGTLNDITNYDRSKFP